MKSFHIAMTCLLAACACAAGQEENLGKEWFLVRVIDADGDPVEGATVLAANVSGQSPLTLKQFAKGQTDAAGRYIIVQDDPTAGISPVLVSKAGLGFGWAELGSRRNLTTTVRLGQAKPVSGTVVDPDGKPVAGATVRAIMVHMGDFMIGISPFDAFITRTDESGRFSFRDIPAGAKLDFIVDAPGLAKRLPEMDSFELPFSTASTDIKITMKPETPVAGKVVDAEGQPVAGVELFVREMALGGLTIRSDAEGKFVVHGLGEGAFTLAEARRPAGQTDWVCQPVQIKLEAGKPAPEPKILVSKGGVVTLSFVDAETSEPIRVGRTVFYPDRDMRADESESRPFVPVQAICDENGRASVRLLPGRYDLMPAAPKGYTLARDEDEDDVVTVEAGKTTDKTIKLKKLPLLTGEVVDIAGKPAPDAEVYLCADYEQESTLTDAQGKFALPLPDLDREDFGMFEGSGGLSQIYLLARNEEQNLASFITVEDTTKPQRIGLAQGVVLTGLLTDADGKPLSGQVMVEFTLPVTEEDDMDLVDTLWETTARADRDGRYIVKAVPKGLQWELTARADGFGVKSAEGKADGLLVEIKPLVLPLADKSISGIVLGPDGKPAAEASVSVETEDQPGGYAETDAEGRFTITGLVAGEVQVNVYDWSDSGPGLTGEATVSAGDKDIRIQLKDEDDWEAPDLGDQPEEPKTIPDEDF